MAIDVKRLVDAIQKKEHAVTSSTSTQDMIDILKAAKKLQGSVINSYADSSYLPDPLTTNERIAYIEDTKVIKLNNGVWDDPTGGVEILPTYSFQGTVSGYSAGGDNGSPSGPWFNNIDKFSFTSDGNATDVADLTRNAGHGAAGQTSSTHGYVVGGRALTSQPDTNIIEKYPFSVDANATDVGDLTTVARYTAGQSSANHGYRTSDVSNTDVIDKHPFLADANATDVGDLSVARWGGNGQSSTTHGYFSSGNTSANTIDKFSFSVDGNATDVGDMTHSNYLGTGQSSSTHGYNSGGSGSNVIEKFPFSTDANSTDVGDLTYIVYVGMGQSSTTSGYASGGNPALNYIQKFPFSTDANATDIGNLTVGRGSGAGSQS